MPGSNGAAVALEVGLDAGVSYAEVLLIGLKLLKAGEVYGDIKLLRSVVKYAAEVAAFAVNDINLNGVGYDNDGTGDHIAHNDAAVDLKLDISKLDVSAETELGSIGYIDDVAVHINGEEAVGDLCACLVVEGGVSIVIISACVEVNIFEEYGSPDVVGVLVVPLQVDLIHIGSDDEQTCIGGGIMVGVGYDSHYQICANACNLNIVVEAELCLIGDVLEHLGEVCAEIIERIDDFGCCACLFKLCVEAGQVVDELISQLSNGDAVGNAGSILSKELVNPSGEVDVDNTSYSVEAVDVEAAVGSDHCADNGGVHIAAVVDGCGVHHIVEVYLLAVEYLDPVFNGDGGLAGLDNEETCACTDIGKVEELIEALNAQLSDIELLAVIEFHIDSGCKVSAGVYGLFGADIALSVGLHAGVVDNQLGIVAERNYVLIVVAVDDAAIVVLDDNAEALGLTVKGLEELIVGNGLFAYELNIIKCGNNCEGTDDGHCILHLVAPVEAESDLQICAVVLYIIRIQPDICLDITVDISSQDFAGIAVDTQQYICNLKVLSAFFDSACALIHSVERRKGHNAVGESGIVPLEGVFGGCGLDEDVAHVIRGLVVAVHSNCAMQIHTDIFGIITADGDHQIVSIKHIDQIIHSLFNRSGHIAGQPQIAQNGICATQLFKQLAQTENHIILDIEQVQNALKLIRQHKLNNNIQSFNAVQILVRSQLINIQTYDELDNIHIDLDAVLICNNRFAVISLAVVDVNISHIRGGGSLANRQSKDSIVSRFIFIVAIEISGILIAANILAGHIELDIRYLFTGNSEHISVLIHQIDRCQQIVVSVLVVLKAQIAIDQSDILAVIVQMYLGSIVKQAHRLIFINKSQRLYNIAFLVIDSLIVHCAELMIADPLSLLGNLRNQRFKLSGQSLYLGGNFVIGLTQLTKLAQNIGPVFPIDIFKGRQVYLFKLILQICELLIDHKSEVFGLNLREVFADIQPFITEIDGVVIIADYDRIKIRQFKTEQLGDFESKLTLIACQILRLGHAIRIIFRSRNHGIVKLFGIGHFNTGVEEHLAVFVVFKTAVGEGHNDIGIVFGSVEGDFKILAVAEFLFYAIEGDRGNEALGAIFLNNRSCNYSQFNLIEVGFSSLCAVDGNAAVALNFQVDGSEFLIQNTPETIFAHAFVCSKTVCAKLADIAAEAAAGNELICGNCFGVLFGCGITADSLCIIGNESTAGDNNFTDGVIFGYTYIFNNQCITGAFTVKSAVGVNIISSFAGCTQSTSGNGESAGLDINCGVVGDGTAVDGQLAVIGPVDAAVESTVIDGQICAAVSIAAVGGNACVGFESAAVYGNIGIEHNNSPVFCTQLAAVVDGKSAVAGCINRIGHFGIFAIEGGILKNDLAVLDVNCAAVIAVGCNSTVGDGQFGISFSYRNGIGAAGKGLFVKVESDGACGGNLNSLGGALQQLNGVAVLGCVEGALQGHIVVVADGCRHLGINAQGGIIKGKGQLVCGKRKSLFVVTHSENHLIAVTIGSIEGVLTGNGQLVSAGGLADDNRLICGDIAVFNGGVISAGAVCANAVAGGFNGAVLDNSIGGSADGNTVLHILSDNAVNADTAVAVSLQHGVQTVILIADDGNVISLTDAHCGCAVLCFAFCLECGAGNGHIMCVALGRGCGVGVDKVVACLGGIEVEIGNGQSFFAGITGSTVDCDGAGIGLAVTVNNHIHIFLLLNGDVLIIVLQQCNGVVVHGGINGSLKGHIILALNGGFHFGINLGVVVGDIEDEVAGGKRKGLFIVILGEDDLIAVVACFQYVLAGNGQSVSAGGLADYNRLSCGDGAAFNGHTVCTGAISTDSVAVGGNFSVHNGHIGGGAN